MKHLFSLLYLLLLSHFAQGQNYSFKESIGQPAIPLAYGSFAFDSQGDLYLGSTDFIAKTDLNGKLKLIIDASLNGDFHSGTNIVVKPDKEGNIWSLDPSKNRLRKFDPAGKPLLTLTPGQYPQLILTELRDIVVDQAGDVYILNTYVIQKIDSEGNLLFRFSLTENVDGIVIPVNLAIDKQGNYWIGDVGSYCLRKYDSKGKYVLKVGKFGQQDGQFLFSSHVSVDREGNIWALDNWNSRVQKFDTSGKFLFKFGSEGKADGKLNRPLDIHVDDQDAIWILDFSRVQKFDRQGNFLSSTNFYGSGNGQFVNTRGVSIDSQGSTWIADEGNARIQKFDGNGKFSLSTGAAGDQVGQFNSPQGIEVDNQNNVWVADAKNNRIQKFSPSGKFLFTLGSSGQSNGQFSNPSDIAIDREGNVWIADTYNHRIQKFDPFGRFLLKAGSYGSADGQFASPLGIAADQQGNIWVADTYNHRIQKFDKNGRFLLKAGSQGQADGQLNLPWSVAIDKEGNSWVADSENKRIVQFDAAGKFLSSLKISNLKPNYLAFDRYANLYCSSTIGVLKYDNQWVKTLIKGKVYQDQNQNCQMESSEKPLADMVMQATPGEYYGVSDSEGNYQIQVDTGSYTVSQLGIQTKGSLVRSICPAGNISSPVRLKSIGDSATGVNFANNVTLAPYLVSGVSSTRRRRCFSSVTTISYSNTGHANASDVKVYVQLPQHVFLKSANKPYIIDKDSNYVFTVGTLVAGQSESIQIVDSVACTASIRGLTACTKVWITPSNTYALPENSAWDKSDITLAGKCVDNGRVLVVVKNTGQSMSDSTRFRVFLDARLAFSKNYKLTQGDSLVLRVPAGGKTVRVEADQRPDHPGKSQTNLTIEACAATSTQVVSKGFVDALPQDDSEDEVAIECLPIIDSYDPNDKQVSPSGTTVERYTPTSSELKYTIRFQNTGTDTAYTVTVIDTLSDKVDMATLQLRAASHNYSFTVSGKGHPVLAFTFAGIDLPDSTRNQKGSNGFIQFTIKPKAGLTEKTSIENFADIIFDYNDPVRTNTTVNVLYDVPSVIDPQNQLPESIIDRVLASEPPELKGKLSVYPNPAQKQLWIRSQEAATRIENILIYNELGQKQELVFIESSRQMVEVDLTHQTRGLYLLRIQTNQGTLIQKLMVQ